MSPGNVQQSFPTPDKNIPVAVDAPLGCPTLDGTSVTHSLERGKTIIGKQCSTTVTEASSKSPKPLSESSEHSTDSGHAASKQPCSNQSSRISSLVGGSVREDYLGASPALHVCKSSLQSSQSIVYGTFDSMTPSERQSRQTIGDAEEAETPEGEKRNFLVG